MQQQAEDGRPYSVKDAANLALSANGVLSPWEF